MLTILAVLFVQQCSQLPVQERSPLFDGMSPAGMCKLLVFAAAIGFANDVMLLWVTHEWLQGRPVYL